MTPLRSLILVLLLLSLVACKPETGAPVATGAAAASADANADAKSGSTSPVRSDTPAEISRAAAPASPAEPGLGEFRIVSVLLGNAIGADKVVLADQESFASGDTIHASVLSTGANQGLRISAKWLAPDGATIADTPQALVPISATATTFSISNPQPWPAGEYQVLIGINGRTMQTRTFRIR